MIIGVPKEIKDSEYRVGMVPSGVVALTPLGHTVLVEKDAGIAAGYPDEEYIKADAKLISDPNYLWNEAELIVKVKEPQPEEYNRLQKNQILFCFLHLAPLPASLWQTHSANIVLPLKKSFAQRGRKGRNG